VSMCVIVFAVAVPAGSVAFWGERCDELARLPEVGKRLRGAVTGGELLGEHVTEHLVIRT